MRYKTVSYYMSNVRRELLAAQREVFDHFGDSLDQIESQLNHGQFLTSFMRENASQFDAIVFFDVDCVPIKKGVIERAVGLAVARQMLIGSSQQANHIEDLKYWARRQNMFLPWRKITSLARQMVMKLGHDIAVYDNPLIYAAPNFLVVPTAAYLKAGSPTFESTHQADVAGEVTIAFRARGLPVKCLKPTSCEKLKYKLGNRKAYGLGTEFGRMVYHAFETTYLTNGDSAGMFLRKCERLVRS